MKNKIKKINYYLITNNYITDDNTLAAPLAIQADEKVNNVGLEFLIAAPADYINSESEVVSIF